MAKAFASAFYKSKAWCRCRQSYISARLAIDGGLCEECRENVGYIVHHKILLTAENINNPEISLNHKYLKYVCKDCHDREEIHEFVKRKSLLCSFDEFGRPIPP